MLEYFTDIFINDSKALRARWIIKKLNTTDRILLWHTRIHLKNVEVLFFNKWVLKIAWISHFFTELVPKKPYTSYSFISCFYYLFYFFLKHLFFKCNKFQRNFLDVKRIEFLLLFLFLLFFVIIFAIL